MKDKIDWELIQRVLEGNHSRENEQRINEWLQSDSLTKKEFDLIRKIWETPAVRMPKPCLREPVSMQEYRRYSPQKSTVLIRIREVSHSCGIYSHLEY